LSRRRDERADRPAGSGCLEGNAGAVHEAAGGLVPSAPPRSVELSPRGQCSCKRRVRAGSDCTRLRTIRSQHGAARRACSSRARSSAPAEGGGERALVGWGRARKETVQSPEMGGARRAAGAAPLPQSPESCTSPRSSATCACRAARPNARSRDTGRRSAVRRRVGR